jgi:hypothetical protein
MWNITEGKDGISIIDVMTYSHCINKCFGLIRAPFLNRTMGNKHPAIVS